MDESDSKGPKDGRHPDLSNRYLAIAREIRAITSPPGQASRHALLVALAEAAMAEDKGEDQSQVVRHALEGVILFLRADDVAAKHELDRPLRMLANALHDVHVGRRPRLFEPPNPPTHRP